MFYDPMISKLCTWAPTRAGAVAGMGRALEDFHIEGLGHNVPFLAAVMDQERFKSGSLSTNYIVDEFPEGFHGTEPTEFQADVMAAAALAMHRVQVRRTNGPGAKRDEWRVFVGKDRRAVKVADREDGLHIDFFREGKTLVLEGVDWRPGKPTFSGVLDGTAFTVQVEPAAEGFIVRHRAAKRHVLVLTSLSADLHERLPEKQAADTSKMVISPMPGLVVTMDVAVGQEVKEGEVVCIIEAMKMQNIIRAERDGVVKTVGAKAGDSVAADEVLVEFG
jgi:propionyl-CoA carboxylase alpha chain